MKKFAAISLSAVLFLQPMAASAVTWGNIVNGLRNSGTNRYTEDGTTIEKDGENYTITGGTLTSDVDYSFLEETGDKTNILLKSLTVDGYVYITADDGKQIKIEVDKDTMVKRRIEAYAEGEKSSIVVVNNGNTREVSVCAIDGGYASATNNGITGFLGGYTQGSGSITEIENAKTGTTGTMSVDTFDKNGKISAVNNGDVSFGAFIGSTNWFDSKKGTYTIDLVNNGNINWMSTFMADGTTNVENNGSYGSEDLFVCVQQGTQIEDIIKYTNGMPNAERVWVDEYAQDEYGVWEVVNSYCLGEDDSDTDEPKDDTECSEPPTFEISKYDRERHEMEMKRQEEAIGGVYGSPYWVKQLYLGYHSLNLRLFIGEKQANFKEDLSWMPDGTKQITLRVNTNTPEKLAMRLDEKALETLERTNFSVITLTDKSGELVMQYSLADLRSVYDQYGLHEADQMIVGGANDDVMKIVNGEMKPIEE